MFDTVVSAHRAVAVRFHPDRVNAGVGSAASSHFLQGFHDIHLFVIDGVRAAFLTGHAEPFCKTIDPYDLSRAQEERAFDRELADRSAAPDGHGVARLNRAVLR